MLERLRWLLTLNNAPTAPIDILRRAVREIARSEAVTVNGERVFPFGEIELLVAPADDLERAVLTRVLIRDQTFERELRSALEARDTSFDSALSVAVRVVDELPADAWAKGYAWRGSCRPAQLERAAPVQDAEDATSAPLELVILRGSGSPARLSLEGRTQVLVGRGGEVQDDRGSVLRRNDLSFEEEGDECRTVSRIHARLEIDPPTGTWWLIDENSRCGTLVARGQERITLDSGQKKIRIKGGDHILLGRAELVVIDGGLGIDTTVPAPADVAVEPRLTVRDEAIERGYTAVWGSDEIGLSRGGLDPAS